MSREISHIISRCVNCSGLHKIRIGQFCQSIIMTYVAALDNEESEVVVLCDSCREKVRQQKSVS